jgi:hypothetical protein
MQFVNPKLMPIPKEVIIPYCNRPALCYRLCSNYHDHHDVAIKELGHLLIRSGLRHPEVSSVVFLGSFCLLWCSFFINLEEMASQNMPVQWLKVAILPLDLPCSGPVTHSWDISVTGKSHKKKGDGSSEDNMEMQHL